MSGIMKGVTQDEVTKELPPLPEAKEQCAEFRRESRRIQPGETLSLVLPDGVVTPLELSVIRSGLGALVCEAILHDINDGGLALRTSARLPAGERVTLCATCETESTPIFAEELVVQNCRRKYESGSAFFVSGFVFPQSAFSRLYKAALDTLFIRQAGLLGAQPGVWLRQ